MKVLERITELRMERNWSEYQLAFHSGLRQSTISSWYRRNMCPNISSLQKICNGFGITMSLFFMPEDLDGPITLTPQQLRVLNYVNRPDSPQIDSLIAFLESLFNDGFLR